MYIHDEIDRRLVEERVAQFKHQMRRFLSGELGDEEFRALRLQNGLYIQRHAPMLRVEIPYGMLVSKQLRMLARIARRWDKGYGHFSTRQNLQLNWPRLQDVPHILAELATVQMHAIQTSGNGIRSTTSDDFAGVAPDELVNPLTWCELIRQWAVLQPECAFLPRKFKIAVSGAATDRDPVGVHDIGLQAAEQDGAIGFRVRVGGALGRTPMAGELINPFVPWPDLLTYLEAILRVYKLHSRRDNQYKTCINHLVSDRTPELFALEVEAQWETVRGGPGTLTAQHVARIADRFTWPTYAMASRAGDQDDDALLAHHASADTNFACWITSNVHAHKACGYAGVTVSLTAPGLPPGDITSDQMDAVADLADAYGHGELRVSHEQNLIMTDVRRRDLFSLWQRLDLLNLATPHI